MSGETAYKVPRVDTSGLFERLFEFSPDAVLVSDKTGSIVRANAQAELIFGYDRQELLGQAVETLIPERFRSIHPKHRSDYAAQPRIRPMGAEFELYARRKDGSEFPVDIMLSPITLGGDSFVLAVVRDITQRKHEEQALRKSEEQLRTLFEFSPDALVVTDTEGKIGEVNAQAEKFFGYARSELLGESIEVLIPERFRATHPKHRLDYVAQPRVRAMGAGLELYGRRKDGSEFPVDIMLGPMDGVEGRMVLGVIRDLSQKKKDEEALRRSEQEKRYLEEEISNARQFEDIVCASPALETVLACVAKVAATDSTVLITGETGTGKELIARAIHKRSQRSSRAFVTVNCAAIPRDLIASELFGHEKGAFTGATQRRLGRFELAEGGTIFLDEIGELPAVTQIALLGVLQDREFALVGGGLPIRCDVRVIAATNRDLEAAMAAGTFRSDLFYRLNIFPIEIPPLRERREDIPLLIKYFIDRYARKAGKNIRGVESETLRLLQSYPWPGNVRELQNVIERSVIVCDTDNLEIEENWLVRKSSGLKRPGQSISESLATQEIEIIEAALAECRGRVYGPSGAASKLGIPPSTLDSRIKSLKIDKKRF